jgi:hypothetical protein
LKPWFRPYLEGADGLHIPGYLPVQNCFACPRNLWVLTPSFPILSCVQVEGVVRFVSAKDVSGGNKIGAVMKDEECFATDEVSVIIYIYIYIYIYKHYLSIYINKDRRRHEG